MSIPVSLDRLRHETGRYGDHPYLLTTGADGRPHAVGATVTWDGERILASAGARTCRNIGEQPLVTLLWPPGETGGYTLIVDGTGEVSQRPDGPGVEITPTRGVLHRPGPAPEIRPGCTSDCLPLHDP